MKTRSVCLALKWGGILAVAVKGLEQEDEGEGPPMWQSTSHKVGWITLLNAF